jgi:phosphate starvation-inducible PhoH-like protein
MLVPEVHEPSPRLIEVTIPLRSHDEAILVLGPYDRHAKLLRQALDIEIYTRSGNLRLKGSDEQVAEAQRRIEHLLGRVRKGRDPAAREIEGILLGNAVAQTAPAWNGERAPGASASAAPAVPAASSSSNPSAANARRGFALAPRAQVSLLALRVQPAEPRSQNQRLYLDAIERNALVFGTGAAGTGKTFLAVCAALRALKAGQCRRLVITRPVVEAGEHLGFLPGDLQAKLNPYTRPVYDALGELLAYEDVQRLEELGVIEIAPLAYMRGRTLSHAFVILDEAQNTTVPQMKMFLTRLGEGSRMVVTGDPSQVDLERNQRSGLADAVRRLRGYEGIATVEFGLRDIVRHPLVEQIVRAYELPSRSEAGDSPAHDAAS